MKIDVQALREISNQLFDYLEETDRSQITVNDDFYWTISKDQLYDPRVDPTDLGLGQLTDDWQELTAIQNGKSPPIAFALVWLAAILRNVGEESVY